MYSCSRAQVLLGNTIRFVDGIDTADLTDQDVARLIMGSAGQPVLLVLLEGRHPCGQFPPLGHLFCVSLVRQPVSSIDAALGHSPTRCASEPPPVAKGKSIPRVLPVRSLGLGPVFLHGPTTATPPHPAVSCDGRGASEGPASRRFSSSASTASTYVHVGTPDSDAEAESGGCAGAPDKDGLARSPSAAVGGDGGPQAAPSPRPPDTPPASGGRWDGDAGGGSAGKKALFARSPSAAVGGDSGPQAAPSPRPPDTRTASGGRWDGDGDAGGGSAGKKALLRNAGLAGLDRRFRRMLL